MIIDYIIISIGLIWLSFAALADIKTREIPDWLNYSLIASILGVYLIASLIEKENLFIMPLIGFGIYFLVGNFMYYAKQWGGGDAKLLMGMGALFSIYPSVLLNWLNPNLQFPLLLSFSINLILIGSVYTLIWLVYFLFRYKSKIFNEIKLNYTHTKKINEIALLAAGLIIMLISLFLPFAVSIIVIILVIACLASLQIFIISKAVEKVVMIKSISITKLTEGDWIVDKNIKKKYNISELGIEKSQIVMLKKSKIKNILIKEGVAFAPVFLITAILTWIVGSWWAVLF